MYLIVKSKGTTKTISFKKRGVWYLLNLIWYGMTSDEVGTLEIRKF